MLIFSESVALRMVVQGLLVTLVAGHVAWVFADATMVKPQRGGSPGASSSPSVRSGSVKNAWNGAMTTFVIFGSLASVLGVSAFFTAQVMFNSLKNPSHLTEIRQPKTILLKRTLP
jgi:hypothetical protein